MARRNLLLCFDAFGTLFRPKQAVAAQYGEVARQLGLGGFGDEELQTSLFGAVKRAMKAHPNYGKSSGMGAAKWWTNVCSWRPGRGGEANVDVRSSARRSRLSCRRACLSRTGLRRCSCTGSRLSRDTPSRTRAFRIS